jgi:hypothetical protein
MYRPFGIIGKAATTSSASGQAGDHGDAPKVYQAPLPASEPRARKEIVTAGEPTSRRVNQGLILAIAKTWMQDLLEGKYHETVEIARREFAAAPPRKKSR